MHIRIGVNPITWSNDDMRELGADITLDTCLLQARAAGFEGIELGHKFPRHKTALAPIMARHKLDLIGGWYSTGLLTRSVQQEMEAASDHICLLWDMDCEVFIMAETTGSIHGDIGRPLSERPALDKNDWPLFCSRVAEFSANLRDLGFLPAYHHHMGTVVETRQDIDRLMDGTGDETGLLLDTGHAMFSNADPVALARDYAARITHVHCKDVRLRVCHAALEDNASFLAAVVDGVFTVPGDGGVDFPSVLQALKDGGYTGWLVVEAEQDPARVDPQRYATLGYDNLMRMARAAGFDRSVT